MIISGPLSDFGPVYSIENIPVAEKPVAVCNLTLISGGCGVVLVQSLISSFSFTQELTA